MEQNVDPVGMIIKIIRQKHSSDLKTSTEYRLVLRSLAESYLVQRCTKTGKLFEDTNLYPKAFIGFLLAKKSTGPVAGGMDYIRTYSIERMPGTQPIQRVKNEKAIQVTRLKNRVNYLERRIANDTENLAVARRQLLELI